MGLETTNPIDGQVASASQWGAAVFRDLSALANVGTAPLLTPSSYVNNTTSFANVTGWASSYTKFSSTSRLLIMPIFTGYMSVAQPTSTFWSVMVDGVDYPCAYYNWNVLSSHMQVVGFAVVPGLLLGVKTIQVRGRINSGTGSLNHDAGDRCSILTLEMP